MHLVYSPSVMVVVNKLSVQLFDDMCLFQTERLSFASLAQDHALRPVLRPVLSVLELRPRPLKVVLRPGG